MGRKKKFTSAKKLAAAIEEYFNTCFSCVKDKKTGELLTYDNGEPITVCIRPPTVTGLALYLGTSRQVLNEYSKDEQYGEIIAAARQRVEQFAEEKLYEKASVTGSIFNLKANFGWSEHAAAAESEDSGIIEIPKVVAADDEP